MVLQITTYCLKSFVNNKMNKAIRRLFFSFLWYYRTLFLNIFDRLRWTQFCYNPIECWKSFINLNYQESCILFEPLWFWIWYFSWHHTSFVRLNKTWKLLFCLFFCFELVQLLIRFGRCNSFLAFDLSFRFFWALKILLPFLVQLFTFVLFLHVSSWNLWSFVTNLRSNMGG